MRRVSLAKAPAGSAPGTRGSYLASKQAALPAPYFGEGIAALANGRLYELTWQHGRGFSYDAETLAPVALPPAWKYATEGWGLTSADGNSTLLMSDGTANLYTWDASSLDVVAGAAEAEVRVLSRVQAIDRVPPSRWRPAARSVKSFW